MVIKLIIIIYTTLKVTCSVFMNEAPNFLAGKSIVRKILANGTLFFIWHSDSVANMAAVKVRPARQTKTRKYLVVLETFIMQVTPNNAHMSYTTNAGRK